MFALIIEPTDRPAAFRAAVVEPEAPGMWCATGEIVTLLNKTGGDVVLGLVVPFTCIHPGGTLRVFDPSAARF